MITINEIRLGMVEARFADIVWQNAPISTKALVKNVKRNCSGKEPPLIPY